MARFRSQLIESERSRLASTLSSSATESISSRSSSTLGSSSRGQPDSLAAQREQAPLSGSRQVTSEQRSSSSSLSSSSSSSTKKTTKISSLTSSSKSMSASERQEDLESQRKQLQFSSPLSGVCSESQVEFEAKSESSKDWLKGLNSPLIQDSSKGRVLRLRFDVTPYEPEQIFVKTIDNRLQIHAKREETSENMSMYREYNREFLLPEGTNPELIRSSLSADGVLTVEAPLPIAAEKESNCELRKC